MTLFLTHETDSDCFVHFNKLGSTLFYTPEYLCAASWCVRLTSLQRNKLLQNIAEYIIVLNYKLIAYGNR